MSEANVRSILNFEYGVNMGMDEAKAKHVVMVKTILDTTVIIVIYSIEKTIQTTKGRIIQRHNLKRG